MSDVSHESTRTRKSAPVHQSGCTEESDGILRMDGRRIQDTYRKEFLMINRLKDFQERNSLTIFRTTDIYFLMAMLTSESLEKNDKEDHEYLVRIFAAMFEENHVGKEWLEDYKEFLEAFLEDIKEIEKEIQDE